MKASLKFALVALALGSLVATGALAEDKAPATRAKVKAPARTPEMTKTGAAKFKLFCATCHGETGAGDGPAAVALNPKPRNFGKDPFKQGSSVEEIFATLATGVPGTPMVGYAHLPEAERWALAYHVNEMVPKQDATKAPDAKGKAKTKTKAKTKAKTKTKAKAKK